MNQENSSSKKSLIWKKLLAGIELIGAFQLSIICYVSLLYSLTYNIDIALWRNISCIAVAIIYGCLTAYIYWKIAHSICIKWHHKDYAITFTAMLGMSLLILFISIFFSHGYIGTLPLRFMSV